MITEIRKEAPVFPEVPRRRLIALFLFLLGLAVFNVWLSGRHYRTGYAVSMALDEQRSLKRQQDLLKTEIMTLRRPSRIEGIARAQLGLVDPKTEKMIRAR
jgi:cell division protein FtsL